MSVERREDDEHSEHQHDEALKDVLLGRDEGYLSSEALGAAEAIVGMKLDESAKALLYAAACLADHLTGNESIQNSPVEPAHLLLACHDSVLEVAAPGSVVLDLARKIPEESWRSARKLVSKQFTTFIERVNVGVFFIHPFSEPARSTIRLTQEAKTVLEDAAKIATQYYESSELSAEHVLASLTLDPSKNPRSKRLIAILEEDGGIIESLVARNTQASLRDLTGLLDWKNRIRREGFKEELHLTSKELAGNFNEYAEAIAETLTVAAKSSHEAGSSNEVSFALFGQWGAGKTSLIDKVNKSLEEHDVLSVKFNAWKYRERPAIWAHMYLCILEKAKQKSRCWLPHQLALRTSLSRKEFAPILGPAIALLLIALLPFAFQMPEMPSLGKALAIIIPLLASIFPLIGFFRFLKRAQLGFGRKLKELLALPNHEEHLGLQATIGEDLSQLLTAATGKIPLKASLSYFAALILFAVALWIHLERIEGLAHLTIHPSVYWPLVIIVSLVILYLALLTAPLQEKPKKIHLIIDDIDRCHEEEMLEVIENVRVLLDDSHFSKSLMVTMLMNREVLSSSLLNRHRALLEAAVLTESDLPQTQIDKYFLLTFDLPPLEGHRLESVVESILHEKAALRPPTGNSTPSPSGKSGKSGEDRESGKNEQRKQTGLTDLTGQEEVKDPDEDSLSEQLSEGEIAQLKILCQKFSQEHRLTPRKIRQFKLRYLFSRILSRHLGQSSFDDQTIAEAYRDYLLEQNAIPPVDQSEEKQKPETNLFYCTLGPIPPEQNDLQDQSPDSQTSNSDT